MEYLNDEKKFANMSKQQEEAGFFNHTFMAEENDGFMWCLWELKEVTSLLSIRHYLIS